MSQTTDADDGWTVIDHEHDNTRTFETRSDAEEAVETATELGGDPELVPPGEGATETADTPDTPADEEVADPIEPAPEATDTVSAPLGVDMRIDADPLDVLPGWMTTQVSYNDRGDSSTTVNKRGCQVIAEYLGLDMVDRTAVKRAHETDFAFATFEVTMAKPDGRQFTGTGTARADGDDQDESEGWKLDMMAETRAYKRAVKSATGGGIEAFAKEQGDA